ncbi:MAG: hypothetical protein V2B13_01065 [Pseudomonadota bacterium]
MRNVIFEVGNGIFSFNLPDVKHFLACYSSEHQVEEATDLLKVLELESGDARKVPNENGFFGYVVLDLLGKGKGSIFCKTCKKEYPSTELQSNSIGFGKNPLTVNLKEKGEFIKRLFGKRIRMGMRGGGKSYSQN